MPPAVPSEAAWRGRRVLVTGHTGFVGGWLCAWLHRLGAHVSGLSLAPPTTPSFFERTGLAARLQTHRLGDVNDASAVAFALEGCDPEIVFHLAAQPLVREAWREPVLTFATNALGTVHVLEACRGRPGVARIVCFTTDKVYRNDQSGRAFTEDDRLGGDEPYSASKSAAELAIGAWWESYFRRASPRPALAVVRAGNIVGGGDWSADRLVPDAIRAFGSGRTLEVRSPGATRPWQHVLDAVRGTLVLAERMRGEDVPASSLAWNLGPVSGEVHPVSDVVDRVATAWGDGARWTAVGEARIPESKALVLSSERAARELGWRCAWGLDRAIAETVAWYRAEARGEDVAALTVAQIDRHAAEAAA